MKESTEMEEVFVEIFGMVFVLDPDNIIILTSLSLLYRRKLH